MERNWSILAVMLVCVIGLWQPPAANAEDVPPVYLQDRGPGIHTSMIECMASLERIAREADHTLPSHDPTLFARRPARFP